MHDNGYRIREMSSRVEPCVKVHLEQEISKNCLRNSLSYKKISKLGVSGDGSGRSPDVWTH